MVYGVSTGTAFVAFLLVRCLMGILTTPLFPAAGRIVAAWIPFGARAWANGLVLGATTIGVSVAPGTKFLQLAMPHRRQLQLRLRNGGLMSDHPTALGGTCSGRFDPLRELFKMSACALA